MDHPADKKLIQKYLLGQCTPDELVTMHTFLLRHDAQEIMDQVWADEWEVFQENEITDQEIYGWKERFLTERLETPMLQSHGAVNTQIQARTNKLWKYAAIWVAITLSVGTYFGIRKYNANEHEHLLVIAMQETVNPYGQRSTIKLADNSVVYLGAGSKLIYPAQFTGNSREITLQGEAFFEVTKNPKKPFVIHTGNIRTWVLGTSFRVNAFADKPLFVEVATGKVRVDQRHAKGKTSLAVLTPGERLNWDNHKAVLTRVNAEDVKEWKNGRLVFNHSTLQELTHVLERWYNVKIKFADPARERLHMTITLTATMPLKQIMEVLASTGRFTYQYKEKAITIN